MLEEPKIKKVDKRDKQLPQNFEQLIEMYDVEKIWPYMKKVIDYINNDLEKIKVSPTQINLSFDHNYVYSSDLDYLCLKIGKMVILNIYAIAFITAMDNYVPFISGLPKPTNYRVFYMQGGSAASGTTARCALTGEGKIQTHWGSPTQYGDSGNKQYSCTLIYETTD